MSINVIKEKKQLLWVIGISVIYWVFISLRFNILYCLNDDIMMQSIMSGGLSGTPSSMAVYMGQPLTALLALLYSVAGNIPWLGLFLAGCYVSCLALVLNRVLSFAKNIKQYIFGICIVVLAFTSICLPQYIMIHYTVAAAVIGSTGLFLVGTAEEKDEKGIKGFGDYIPLIICFLIRRQVFFILLPFIFGILFYRIISDKIWKIRLKKIGVFGAIVLLFGIVHGIMYSQGGWKEYSEFNKVRTDLYDYTGVWEGEAATSYYDSIGITNDQMSLYLSYDLMLDEQLSVDCLEKMAEFNPGEYGIKSPMAPTMGEVLWSYRTGLLSRGQEFPYNYLIIFMYLGLIVLAFTYKNWKGLAITVCFGIGRSAIWIYLMLQGRFPERVSLSLFFIEIITLICVAWNILRGKEKKGKQVIGKAVVILFTLLLPVVAFINMKATLEKQDNLIKQNKEDCAIYNYFDENPEKLYLMDVYATVNRTQYAILDNSGKKENYLILGGWITGSPLVEDKLALWGYDSAIDALLHGENVYFVKKENTGLSLEVLESIFEGYRLELCDSIYTEGGNVFMVYQVK